ncbi:hypothetical protein R4K19_11000 [Pseudomonas aeruginosa]|uniref:hypothetical protein n=1 Tax=Pseudomonas aeruginosa TaxID=287 RepID=UPI0029545061|nr:hypothetical protein [Pseudomonas aeruginosa]MDV8131519.1 hypothetical protein [Pseudomonas aeruginosa]
MSNELTDVRCPCGAEFQADSYDAGFIAGSGMCQNCDAALPPKDICTCPSGDGSLRHPCPAHIGPFDKLVGSPVHNESEPDLPPLDEHLAQVFETGMALSESVEQAGGDEREEFLAWACKEYGIEDKYDLNENHHSIRENKKGWMARAALAIASSAQTEHERDMLGQALGECIEAAGITTPGTPLTGPQLLMFAKDLKRDLKRAALAQPSPASDLDPLNLAPHAEAFNEAPAEALKSEQAEAERPEVVAYADPIAFATFKKRGHEGGVLGREWMWAEPSAGLVAMSRTDECECIIGELRSERDAALARVAELEKQEPVATVAKVPGEDWNGLHFYRDLQGMQPGTKLYAAPVAQAQQLHDLDKQCRDDVARALGLRPSQERGFAWSYLLASIKSCVKASEDAAQAQHSVPEEFIGRLSEFLAQRGGTGKALLRDLRTVLAAAPIGKRSCEYAGCCNKAHPGTSLCIAHHSKKAREQLLAAAPGKEEV